MFRAGIWSYFHNVYGWCVGLELWCHTRAKLPSSSCGLKGNKHFLVTFPLTDQATYQFLLSLRLCCLWLPA